MKNIKKFVFVLILLGTQMVQGQGFPYKALITDNNGNALSNQNVTVYFDLYDPADNTVYSEVHSTTTDANGIVNVNIGEGTVMHGNFHSLEWAVPYELEVWIDTDGSGAINFGRFPLKYVPYAKYAESGGSVSELNDLDDARVHDGGSSIFIGVYAGENNDQTDNRNVGIGYSALQSNTDGTYNTGIGYKALQSNTSGVHNSALGNTALYSNTTGNFNTAVGSASLNLNTTGSRNTAMGYQSSPAANVGNDNIAIGFQSMFSNASGNANIAIGNHALYSNIRKNHNIAVGDSALYNTGAGVPIASTEGEDNVVIGFKAGFYNSSGHLNVAMGNFALQNNTTGAANTALGTAALYANRTGTGNTALGFNSGFSNASLNNTIAIGFHAGDVSNQSNRVEIGNTSVSWIGGQVTWSTYSDARIKTGVREDVVGLDFIKRLRPVTYHLDIHHMNDLIEQARKTTKYSEFDWPEKYDIEQMKITGFIAQEVEQAAKESGYDFSGVQKADDNPGFYSISYAQFVVPLVKAVQEQQEMIERQQRKIEELENRLNTLKNQN